MVKKNIENEVEFDFVGARILSKEDSSKNSDNSDGRISAFSEVQTGHCKPATGHLQKEIGPGERFRVGFRVFLVSKHDSFELATYSCLG